MAIDHSSPVEATPSPMGALASEPPIQFFIAKGGQEYGPYDQNQILTMLQTGEVTKRDLVYYDQLGAWKRIDEVFEVQEQLTHFMDEGQEPEVVVAVYSIIADMLGYGEEIYYIAHQRKKFLRSQRDVVIVSNQRLLVMKHHLTSYEVDDYIWRNIVSVHTKEGLMGSVFAVRLTNDRVVEIDDLPHAQIAKLVQLSQEMRVG
jgi:hypothetical protein